MSALEPGATPEDDLPRVAFSGRSNVGKSSLINTILRRTQKKIAHVSARPGKTRALNFYRVNDAFFLVDLPGYGYAKAPAAVREAWKGLVEGYLAEEARLSGVVHLVDARREPTELDIRMVGYLAELALPTLVILTKIDKLKRRERAESMRKALEVLALDQDQVLPFSSKTGEGRDALLDALERLMEIEDTDEG